MLRFIKHCKERLMILMSFCSKFIVVLLRANNHFTVNRFDEVIAKNKMVQFFCPTVYRPNNTITLFHVK